MNPLDKNCALLVVDVQRDFCKGGSLAVPGGDDVVPALARAVRLFEEKRLAVIYTRDWHPPDHCSFASRGGPWPEHCVAGTPGAEFHPGLPVARGARIVSKAASPGRDAYSGFDGTGLAAELRGSGIRRIFVGGLATDYCVKATALDGIREGFEVHLLPEASRAVDILPGDGARAIAAMEAAGVKCAALADLAAAASSDPS